MAAPGVAARPAATAVATTAARLAALLLFPRPQRAAASFGSAAGLQPVPLHEMNGRESGGESGGGDPQFLNTSWPLLQSCRGVLFPYTLPARSHLQREELRLRQSQQPRQVAAKRQRRRRRGRW